MRKSKTLISYNLNRFVADLQEAILDGYRVDVKIAARRSLGNKFSVVLVKDDIDQVSTETEPSTETVVDSVSNDIEKEIDYSTLKVSEIKAVLTEKGIDFDGVTRKDELLALIPKNSSE